MTEYLYRYDTYITSSGVHLSLSEYKIIKHTRCGVRISLCGGSDVYTRFVNQNCRKQWACKTPEEAFTSFQARKFRQLQILKTQIQNTEAALQLTPNNLMQAHINLGVFK